MFEIKNVPLPDYTRKEDMINSITHALGVPLSIGAVWGCLAKAGTQYPVSAKICIVIYGLTMMWMYLGSAVYHGMKPSFAKKLARVLDHSNIFVMIAGTLSLFYIGCLKNFKPVFSVVMCAVSCAACLAGILLTYMDQERFKKVQLIMYVAIGWTAVLGSVFIAKTGEAGKALVIKIIIGGALYTVGAVCYVIGKKIRYIHAVFHVFILAASVVQLIGIYDYIG